MTITERYFLSVLGRAIRGDVPPSPPDGLDWAALYRLADRHQLAGTAGAMVSQLPGVPREIAQRFTDAHTLDIYLDTVNQVETEGLYQALSARKVPYAPFKGIVMKRLYPSTVVRTMNDVDILVQPENMEAARAAMKEAGFQFQYDKSVHSVFYKEPRVWVELHSGVLSHWSRYYAFYNDIWARMTPVPEDPCRYRMSEEYVYLTALLHFEKHLTNKGANAQQILDIYVLAERNGISCEKESIAAALRSLKLLTFAQNAEALARAWFTGGALSKKQEALSRLILSGGKGGYALHGEYQQHFVKRKPVFTTPRSLFLPTREELAQKYPGLRGKPRRYLFYWALYLVQGGIHMIQRGIMVLARLWLRMTGKADWVGLYKEAHKKRLG